MGILANFLYLLRRLDAVLYLPEPFEVVRLLLRHFQFEGCHLLIFAARHLFGRRLQCLSRPGKLLTDPRAVSDADGQSHDTEEFHHVHRPAPKHHHPALVGTHAKGKA